jgi:hypothetical protein
MRAAAEAEIIGVPMAGLQWARRDLSIRLSRSEEQA